VPWPARPPAPRSARFDDGSAAHAPSTSCWRGTCSTQHLSPSIPAPPPSGRRLLPASQPLPTLVSDSRPPQAPPPADDSQLLDPGQDSEPIEANDVARDPRARAGEAVLRPGPLESVILDHPVPADIRSISLAL